MQTTIDQETFTIAFERNLAASREEVFDAWTIPDRVSEWWDPTGTRLVECTIDLKPRGAFRFVNEGHGPPFAGVYSVLERPSLLDFDALGSVGTVALEADGATTKMRVTIRCSSKEHLDMFVRMGVASGTERTLDNLVAYVRKAR